MDLKYSVVIQAMEEATNRSKELVKGTSSWASRERNVALMSL